MERDTSRIARAYDDYASSYSERFADPLAIARRHVDHISAWGWKPPAGSRVVELGCGNGYITEQLARAGFQVTAVDLSPKMVSAARRRLEALNLEARFVVADGHEFVPDSPAAITLACLRTFFRYLDPGTALNRISTYTTRKVLIDLNPRETEQAWAADALRAAGFQNIDWRPMFVPTQFRLPRPAQWIASGAERTPVVRDFILRKKFTIILKGEK